MFRTLCCMVFSAAACLSVAAQETQTTRPPGKEKRDSESPEQQPQIEFAGELHIVTKAYWHTLAPVPGLKADVFLGGGREFEKRIAQIDALSDEELRRKYSQIKDRIERSYRASKYDETQMKELKRELVTILSTLKTKSLEDVDYVFSIATRSPSIAEIVITDFSYVRLTQNAFAAQLKGAVVPDGSGIALGFLRTDETDGKFEGTPGVRKPLVWSFRKAVDQQFPDATKVYEILMQVTPSTFGKFTTPANQTIVRKGRLENKDWVYELNPPTGFQEQKLSVSAVLRSYRNEKAFNAGEVLATDHIDVPLATLILRPKPSSVWAGFKDALAVLKDLFGVIGGIPTAILGWIGLRPILKKRRSKRKPPQRPAQTPAAAGA